MEKRNLIKAEFKTLVIRMLNELNENFNSMKKGMATTKTTSQKLKIHY